MQLLSADLRYLGGSLVLDNCVEKAINQRIRISLPADAHISAVEESSVLEHLPDGRVTPVVWIFLWIDFYLEIVVTALKNSWSCENLLEVETQHPLSCVFEGVVERLLILGCFTLTV